MTAIIHAFRLLALASLALLGLVRGAASQEADPDQQVAKAFLAEEAGLWTSRWEWLGEDGEIIGTMQGEENFEFVIPETVLMNTNTISGEPPRVSKAFIFYNPVQKKLFFISVGETSDHWVMSGSADGEVLTSEPHLMPDGKTLMLRFTMQEKAPGYRKIYMERSWNNGETWEPGFYQYLRRPPQTFSASGKEEHPARFSEVNWQSATPEDIHVFDPYIGRFRSATHTSDSGKEYYFTVSYAWYNQDQTLVKFTVKSVVPSDNMERVVAEGFYGYDPFTQRIFSHGYFPRGIAGFGWVSEFDRESHQRVTRVHSQGSDGAMTEVRDTFWVIDENSWGNATFISQDGGPWQKISEGVYSRIES